MNATMITSLPTRALGETGIQGITFSISTLKGIPMRLGVIAPIMRIVSDSPLGRRLWQGYIAMNLW